MDRRVTQGWHEHRLRRARGPERQLLLRLAASGQVRRAGVGTIRDLARRADAERLAAMMVRQRVLGVLGPRLLAVAPDSLGPEGALRVDAYQNWVRRRAQLHEMALGRVLEGLADAGIACVTLKGPRFAQAIYGDVGARPSGDLDVLVPVDRLSDAQATLTRLGWYDRGDLRDRSGLPLLHVASVHQADLPTIELHWRVHWLETRFAQDALARSVAAGTDRLLPGDELLALLLYIARDGLAGVRLVVDTVSWLDHYGRESLATVSQRLVDYPELRAAAEAALRLVARVEGTGLAAPSPRSLRERAADALADPLLLMPPKQTKAERSLIDLLLAPRPAEAVGRQLIPTDRVLRAWADHQPRPPSAPEVAAHTARSLRRYALAGVLRVRTATGGDL